MVETYSSPEASAGGPLLHAYLEYNRKLQMWAWLSAAIAVLIILSVVIYGTFQLKRLEQKITQKEGQLARDNAALANTQSEIRSLEEKRFAVLQQINAYTTSPASSKGGPASAFSVSGHPVTISINISETRNREEAEMVAELFRSHGYTVTGIVVKRRGEATHETTVRFFQYDKSTVAIGRNLVGLMKRIGFKVRTEFDDEYVGAHTGPDPGTYQVWIGIDPSYSPPNVNQ